MHAFLYHKILEVGRFPEQLFLLSGQLERCLPQLPFPEFFNVSRMPGSELPNPREHMSSSWNVLLKLSLLGWSYGGSTPALLVKREVGTYSSLAAFSDKCLLFNLSKSFIHPQPLLLPTIEGIWGSSVSCDVFLSLETQLFSIWEPPQTIVLLLTFEASEKIVST